MTTTCLFVILGASIAGCDGPWSADQATPDRERGPKLVRTTPPAGGELDAALRHVVLEFDRELDTGAQLVVEYERSDVTAGVPELSSDRRRLETDVDVEDAGTYRVTWRACSARVKTDCGEGEFEFRSSGR